MKAANTCSGAVPTFVRRAVMAAETVLMPWAGKSRLLITTAGAAGVVNFASGTGPLLASMPLPFSGTLTGPTSSNANGSDALLGPMGPGAYVTTTEQKPPE